MLCRRCAGLDDDALISISRQRDGSFEWHVHRRYPERGCRQQQSIHALGDCMADHLACVDVSARWQMRTMLLNTARRKNHDWIFFELLCDLGLRELDEMTTGKHTLAPFTLEAWLASR